MDDKERVLGEQRWVRAVGDVKSGDDGKNLWQRGRETGTSPSWGDGTGQGQGSGPGWSWEQAGAEHKMGPSNPPLRPHNSLKHVKGPCECFSSWFHGEGCYRKIQGEINHFFFQSYIWIVENMVEDSR